MVQRKVCSELGVQDDHVKSERHMANLKLASPQNQDSKSRRTEGIKKMKMSSSIEFSDLEALQSPPSWRSLSQPRKSPPLHVPTTSAASPQKRKPLVRRSPNYMKPTSSSDAKKDLLPVNLRNIQYGSDGKNLPQQCSSNSKATSVSSTKPAKTVSRSSSMNSFRTLTETPSLKPWRACPRKSTTAVLCADINAPERATCSSTLKDSKFPAYLMLNPEGSESGGASVMKICPYTYCSLNGNHHAPFPQFNSIMSARRRLLKARKSVKLEAPQRLKVPCETKKDVDTEKVALDGKPACDEAGQGNPITIRLTQEIGMDFFIEIYAKEREEADEMGRFDSNKHLEDQEGIKFSFEGNGNAAEEEGVKQVIPSMPHDLPKFEIDPKEDFENYFDAAAIEEDTKGSSFHQEPNAEDADENHPPSWFHEETCTRSYCREVSYDGEHMENIELDGSDSQNTDIEWEEEQFCAVNHEEDIGSTVVPQEETDSKLKSSSESPHDYDISEMWLHDILSNHYMDIMVEKTQQEAKEGKTTCYKAQPHDTNSVQEGTSESTEFKTRQTDYPLNSTSYENDQSSLRGEAFQHLTNTEDNNSESEKHLDNEASCSSMVLDEDTVEVENGEGHKICETCKIEESHEDSNTNLENDDEEISQEKQIPLSDAPEESNQELQEEDQVIASKFQTINCIGSEEKNTSKNWKWEAKCKRPVQEVEEMRKINPRKPNFLPLVPDPEPEKVNLKHQMMDERKNAEEWMLDFALRQAVTKLAPAGKKKVALLVEAFETVVSIPKCETHIRNNSPFVHARPIQACS